MCQLIVPACNNPHMISRYQKQPFSFYDHILYHQMCPIPLRAVPNQKYSPNGSIRDYRMRLIDLNTTQEMHGQYTGICNFTIRIVE